MSPRTDLARLPGYRELQAEFAAFLYLEADLLDGRDYTGWLELLADDIT